MKYLPQLDGLRALAILMVFLHHAFNIPLLWSGVDLFFILSGYLITNILMRDRERLSFGTMIGRFYLRRAERILPAYLIFLVLAFFFLRPDLERLWVYYVFFLQNIPYAFQMVHTFPLFPLWSLAVEQHFYLFWPVLVYYLPRRWLAPSMIGLLVAVPVLRGLCTPLFATSDAIYCLTPFRIDTMAAGALAALVLPHCKPLRAIRIAQVAMVLAAVAYLLLGMHPWFRRPANTVVFNSLAYSLNILILGGLFVWAALAENTWLTRLLSTPLLRGLGRISYMFYLLHLLVLAETVKYLGSRGWVVAAAFALTAGLATLSWFAVEKPVLSLSASHRRAAAAKSAVAL